MTSREVAVALGVGVQRVLQLVSLGLLGVDRYSGRSHLFSPVEVAKLKNRRAQRPGSRGPLPDMEKREAAIRLYKRAGTYAEMGKMLGVSRQRAQQLVRPIWKIRLGMMKSGVCGDCGAAIGDKGHIHHKSKARRVRFNALPNLIYLCVACHGRIHGKHSFTPPPP